MKKNDAKFFVHMAFLGAMVYLLPFLPQGLWAALPVLYFMPSIYRLLKTDALTVVWRLRAKFARVKVTDEELEEFMTRK